MDNTPVYDYDEAIDFISDRCNVDRDIIDKILMLEEDYMRKIGIICDKEYKEIEK